MPRRTLETALGRKIVAGEIGEGNEVEVGVKDGEPTFSTVVVAEEVG